MSEFKPCPVCQEQSDQCLSCASYVVGGERIYYEKLKDFGATKDHEIRFINRIQKHRVTAFFHDGKLYIPSRQGRSVPLAIGLQWDAWQEQQTIIDNLKAQINNMEACYIGIKKINDEQSAIIQGHFAARQDMQKRIDEYKKLTVSIRNEFDLWSDDSEFADVIEAQIENLEALRGAND